MVVALLLLRVETIAGEEYTNIHTNESDAYALLRTFAAFRATEPIRGKIANVARQAASPLSVFITKQTVLLARPGLVEPWTS